MRSWITPLLAAVACLGWVNGASAQPPSAPQSGAPGEKPEEWYYQSTHEAPTPRMIIQQKAQARAMARIRRIEANAAYGFSNARPTVLPTPTGLYSPAWQMPGGRPFGWFTTQRPAFYGWR